jgi:hypothetical protein
MTRHLDETRTVCATIREIVMQTAEAFHKSCSIAELEAKLASR